MSGTLKTTLFDSGTRRITFESLPQGFKRPDVFPWRYNRRLSYLRRPLLERLRDGRVEVVWGPRAVRQASTYLTNLCFDGHIKEPCSQEMKTWIGVRRNLDGERFNDRVADWFEGLAGFVVRRRLKKILGKKLLRRAGQELGDVDVLAVDVPSRRVWVIETKCFATAITPVEVSNERAELFGDLTNRTGAVGIHLERLEWVHSNLSMVLEEMRVAAAGESFDVEAMLVLDTDLVSMQLVALPLKVVTLSVLEKEPASVLGRVECRHDV